MAFQTRPQTYGYLASHDYIIFGFGNNPGEFGEDALSTKLTEAFKNAANAHELWGMPEFPFVVKIIPGQRVLRMMLDSNFSGGNNTLDAYTMESVSKTRPTQMSAYDHLMIQLNQPGDFPTNTTFYSCISLVDTLYGSLIRQCSNRGFEQLNRIGGDTTFYSSSMRARHKGFINQLCALLKPSLTDCVAVREVDEVFGSNVSRFFTNASKTVTSGHVVSMSNANLAGKVKASVKTKRPTPTKLPVKKAKTAAPAQTTRDTFLDGLPHDLPLDAPPPTRPVGDALQQTLNDIMRQQQLANTARITTTTTTLPVAPQRRPTRLGTVNRTTILWDPPRTGGR